MPKIKTNCAHCQTELTRWPINPNTKLPIKNFFCNKDCKGKWQISQRESLGFTKDWLIDQYINQGKDANQIASEVGRDGKSVWNWLSVYGIQTRSRGHNTSHLPKDGSTFRGKHHSNETKEKIRAASLLDGRVPYLKNGDHWLKGVSKEDHPNWIGGLTPDRQSVYASQAWIDAVKSVWSRDKATCQRCGKHHNTSAIRGTFHIHHLVSFQVKELRTDPSNLVLLCKECHKYIHSKTNIEKQYIKELVTC